MNAIDEVTLTCVGCGKTESMLNRPAVKRDCFRKDCGAALIDRRAPGNTTTTA